uniref:Uncharacterized protein n=1 Tax=Bursaphelenchus xylophilus TaxID=6326 RepID=A0A1I7RL45_BURXY
MSESRILPRAPNFCGLEATESAPSPLGPLFRLDRVRPSAKRYEMNVPRPNCRCGPISLRLRRTSSTCPFLCILYSISFVYSLQLSASLAKKLLNLSSADIERA